MLRNIAITQSRKAKLRREYATGQMAIESAVAPPNQLYSLELKESLRLVKSLPARERQAVTLLGIFNMTYEEAAQHSGSQVGTMKSRLSRARDRLRILAEPLGAAA